MSTGTAPTASTTEEVPGPVERGAHAAQEHGGAVLASAKDQASEVARSAADHARTVFDSATEELREQSRTRATELSGTLEQVSGELRAFADNSSGSTMLADVVRSLANTSQRAARRLDDAGPEGVVQDVARFGRTHPGQFVAIAAASGFAAGRLFRSMDTSAVKDALTSAAGSSSSDEGSDGVSSDGNGSSGNGFSPSPTPTPTMAPSTSSSWVPPTPTPAAVAPIDPAGSSPEPQGGQFSGDGPTAEIP